EPSNRPILSCSKRSALRPTILKKIPSACDTLNSAHSTCSSAPASSKPAARPSLVPAANSPACSGQYAARPPSSLSAAATSTDALKTTGLTVRWLEFHSHVVHPGRAAPGRVLGAPDRARYHQTKDFTSIVRWFFADMARTDPQWIDSTIEQLSLNIRSIQRHKTPMPPVLTDTEWRSL